MGFFDKIIRKSLSVEPLSVVIKQLYGFEQLSPQMDMIDRFLATVSNLTVEQIRSFESGSKGFDLDSPGQREAFDAIFSSAIGSGRLDAVIDSQDRITDVAENSVRRAMGVRYAEESMIPLAAVAAITALYMRDWIDREITDAEFDRYNQPPYLPSFVITQRKMSLDDYLIVTKPWRNFIGPLHPSD